MTRPFVNIQHDTRSFFALHNEYHSMYLSPTPTTIRTNLIQEHRVKYEVQAIMSDQVIL